MIEVSKPAAPLEVGYHETAGGASGMAAAGGKGNYVCVAASVAGLEVVTSCVGLLFQDSFETGDPSVWSLAVP